MFLFFMLGGFFFFLSFSVFPKRAVFPFGSLVMEFLYCIVFGFIRHLSSRQFRSVGAYLVMKMAWGVIYASFFVLIVCLLLILIVLIPFD